MPKLPAENRFIIAMAVILAVIILIAVFGYVTSRWETQP
jgi:hypothetical protein